jgi:YD repeat-containing protein
VLQPVDATQTRTFTYDGAYLASAANPENGTVQYFYDANARLSSTVDAKGQRLERIYDSYNRVIELRKYPNGATEDLTQRVTYFYDSNPFSPAYSQNAAGRLAAVQYARRYPEPYSVQAHDD